MDLKNDYTSKTIKLNPDFEGEVIAVLTASNFNTGDRKAVLKTVRLNAATLLNSFVIAS